MVNSLEEGKTLVFLFIISLYGIFVNNSNISDNIVI